MPRKYLGIVLALAVALVSGPAASAAAQPLVPATTVNLTTAKAKPVKVTTANLNLRKSANVKSSSLVVIPKNTGLTILKVSGAWNQVTYRSKTGWVSGSYLKAVPASRAKVYNYVKAFTTVKAKAASSSANVVSVHRQAKVEVLGRSGSWTKVRVSGKTGFVAASSLSKSNPATVSRWVKGNQPVFTSNRTSSKKLGTLANNTKVTWLRTSGAWQQVRTSAGMGWLPSRKLSNAAIKPPAKVYNYVKAFTAVKAKAASSSKSLVSIHRQTRVEVLGRSGSWTKVRVSGKTGFVASSSLSKSKPAVVSRWVKGNQSFFASNKSSSKKLGTLANNTKVTWLRTTGAWQQVRTSAGMGWLPSSKLSNAAIKPPVKAKVYNYTKSFTTVKAKAYRSSANLIWVQRQTKVEVLQNKGSWTKVRVSGKTGFVPTSALSKTSPATVSRWVKGKQPVYVSAKTSSRKISTLPNNTKVTWLRTSGAWQQVRTSAGIGWMRSTALSTKAIPVAPSKPPVKFNAPRWTTENVNLRTGPGTSNKSLGAVPKGERVLLGTSVNGWANVKTSRGTGWISTTSLSTVSPTQKPPTPDAMKFDSPRWTTANLNLRNGAGTNYDALGMVPMGERVLRGRSNGGWANVKTSKGIGWVNELYLATTAPPPKPTTQYRWSTGNVNLRAGGSTVYPIMGVVQAGDRVTYLGSRNGWAHVVTNVGTGWMSETYLSKTRVAKLQPDTIAVNNAVKGHFGSWVTSYGGVRPGSVGHSSGRATDLMIKDYKSPQSIKNGDKIADFLIANRKSLGISYLIWQDKIWLGTVTGWEEYSKSGKYGQQFVGDWSDTTLHLDHIHAETIGNAGTGEPLVR